MESSDEVIIDLLFEFKCFSISSLYDDKLQTLPIDPAEFLRLSESSDRSINKLNQSICLL